MNGNFLDFASLCVQDGLFTTVYNVWPNPWDPVVWKMIGSFMVFELFLQRCMPGEEFRATVTAGGNVPIYTANGMKSYVMTIMTLLGLTYYVSFF